MEQPLRRWSWSKGSLWGKELTPGAFGGRTFSKKEQHVQRLGWSVRSVHRARSPRWSLSELRFTLTPELLLSALLLAEKPCFCKSVSPKCGRLDAS